jgi:tetratricopeptide (TPR) repeat protein
MSRVYPGEALPSPRARESRRLNCRRKLARHPRGSFPLEATIPVAPVAGGRQGPSKKAAFPGKIPVVTRAVWILLLLVCPICASTQGFAADSGLQNTGATSPAKPRLGQAGSQQELDDYNKLHTESDPGVKRELIDQFAVRYAESGLLAYVYQDGVYLGRQMHNIEIMAEYGEKSLELWPENYTLLTELGSAFVQRNRVDEAEAKATRAIDLVVKAERPAYMSERQWAEGRNMLLASNNATLGYVHLRRAHSSKDPVVRRYEAEIAIPCFERALKYHSMDDFTYYGLGFAYAVLDDYGEAESNLAKAVAINGIVAAGARSLLEEIYKSRHKQSLNGLELIIAKARAALGIS